MQQPDTTFSLDEGTPNGWGYQLIRAAHDLPAARLHYPRSLEPNPQNSHACNPWACRLTNAAGKPGTGFMRLEFL